MHWIGIIIFLITWIIALYLIFKYKELSKNAKSLNILIDTQNYRLEKENEKLKLKKEQLQDQIEDQRKDVQAINELIKEESTKLKDLQQNVILTSNTQKELSQNAFENYCEILNKSYQEREEEYNKHITLLKESYANIQAEINAELDKIQATRTAALQAQLKEKEIKEKLSFYCLTVKQTDLDDIKVLERIKSQLHNPRILSMLIWSTYFQKPMTNLCNNVIGTEIKSGIYKITNQKDNLCYIGQAVDLARRWKDHAKCGLGIDTPASNKLYQSMIEDGIWNFSFEILEECPREQLNEKEKYYINLYDSKNYGYNVTKGNN